MFSSRGIFEPSPFRVRRPRPRFRWTPEDLGTNNIPNQRPAPLRAVTRLVDVRGRDVVRIPYLGTQEKQSWQEQQK